MFALMAVFMPYVISMHIKWIPTGEYLMVKYQDDRGPMYTLVNLCSLLADALAY
jgi:hypothetical protein